jgi:hypothetical protein
MIFWAAQLSGESTSGALAQTLGKANPLCCSRYLSFPTITSDALMTA